MKKNKKITCLLLVALLILNLAPLYSAVAAPKVKLNKSKITLKVNQTKTIKITGTSQKVKWKNGNKKVIKVTSANNKSIQVQAIREGKAQITAQVGKKKYYCKIIVRKRETREEKNDKKENITIALSQTAVIVNKGEQTTLSVNVLPTSYQNDVLWYSSNEEIATVRGGIITGVNIGTCNVSAIVGGVSATCLVQVNQPYGALTGTVTYHYNQYRGYVADTGARVYVLDSVNKKKVGEATVDGNGNYSISNIPVGTYNVLIQSSNSKTKDFTNISSTYMKDVNFYKSTYGVELSIAGRIWTNYLVEILPNQTVNSGYQFGYTDF